MPIHLGHSRGSGVMLKLLVTQSEWNKIIRPDIALSPSPHINATPPSNQYEQYEQGELFKYSLCVENPGHWMDRPLNTLRSPTSGQHSSAHSRVVPSIVCFTISMYTNQWLRLLQQQSGRLILLIDSRNSFWNKYYLAKFYFQQFVCNDNRFWKFWNDHVIFVYEQVLDYLVVWGGGRQMKVNLNAIVDKPLDGSECCAHQYSCGQTLLVYNPFCKTPSYSLEILIQNRN